MSDQSDRERSERPKRRRRNYDDSESSNSGTPYIEANPDMGEIPLDEIDTFVVPGRDEKGGQAHVQLSMTPYMYRQIQIVVASRRFPYLDVSDFIRHACYRNIGFCVSIRHSLPKHISPSLEAMMEVCRDAELRLRVVAAFEEIDRQIANCLSHLEIPEAIRLMTILKNRIDEVTPSPRQKQVRSEILRRYGYVLEHNGDVRAARPGDIEDEVPEDTAREDKKTGGKGEKKGGFQ